MSISGDESGAELPEPSFPTLPDKEQHTERILTKRGLREFLVVDHTANVRKNSKISAIWHHGGERHRLNDKSLHRYALDHLSCPAMATQCERVFSAAKRTLTPERNALGTQIIEACECLR